MAVGNNPEPESQFCPNCGANILLGGWEEDGEECRCSECDGLFKSPDTLSEAKERWRE